MHSHIDVIGEKLKPHAVRISTRKRQIVPIRSHANEMLFYVRSGLFLARVTLPDQRHRVLAIHYQGDLVRAEALPPLDGADLATASETGDLLRTRWGNVAGLMEADGDIAGRISDRLAAQSARLALNHALVSGVSGDERVAGLMTELVLRTGRQTSAGIVFDMPLARADIAEYLALNPDTVSRIVSRMRASGLVVPATRDRLVCRDFEALSAACPLAPAIRRLNGEVAATEMMA